ncbi:hypothetical protein [Mucilaginibacter auburnensis]|uniref:Uncharacterized protein n=1 Tax=Mucilaginibacter auburnensis TaxID=1457233 RepID=A0A2H9VS24_9SPHI|nr:hypothetical protein [Mucilaginibacter auburnensis]PJJ83627.1 hypothetical protein CLV57_0613 [Mucilaginibacter auburnensis]
MPNIKFSYLYRDADNYKNFGYVVFDNPTNMELAEVVHHLKSNLIDGCWFYAKRMEIA